MPKESASSKIENEIETLPTTEQLKLFDWLGKRLVKRAKPATLGRKRITEKINKVYASESPELDPSLVDAQLASIEPKR